MLINNDAAADMLAAESFAIEEGHYGCVAVVVRMVMVWSRMR